MVKEKPPPHDWKPGDDILAFYLYRFGEGGEITKNRALIHIGIPIEKLEARISDYGKIEKGTKGRHTCSQEEDAYDEYILYGKDKHRKKCLEILKNK